MTRSLWDKVDKEALKTISAHLRSHPVRVGELANALGIKVVRSPLAPKISGLIQPCDEARAGFEIRVNKYEVPERQRFTVAHEIAHYLLHRDSIGAGVFDTILYRSNLTSRKETEANQLAAEIIMPGKLITKELDRLGGMATPDVADELAKVFKVSTPAMKIRIGLN